MAYTEEQIENIKTRILSALEEVIDPELGIDIVNLGLIYEIRFDGDTGQTEIENTIVSNKEPTFLIILILFYYNQFYLYDFCYAN